MPLLKLLPSPVAKFLAYTGLANCLSNFISYGPRSLAEVVNSLTENKELRAVLCYIFGTYGQITQLLSRAVAPPPQNCCSVLLVANYGKEKDACFKTVNLKHPITSYSTEERLYLVVRCVVFVGNPPKEASFSMHSLLMSHYLPGAWYPKGGASQIAYNMIPIIEKAGGAVLVRASVNRILLNAANEAIGNIKTSTGSVGCKLLYMCTSVCQFLMRKRMFKTIIMNFLKQNTLENVMPFLKGDYKVLFETGASK